MLSVFQPLPDQIEARKDSASAAGDSARAAERRKLLDQQKQAGGVTGVNSWQTTTERPMTRLWVVGKNKKLTPIYVRPGIADGTFTEILQGKVEEGQEIVVGVMSQRPTASATPFTQPGGGGGRRF